MEPSVQPVAEPTLETTVVPPPPPPKPVPVVQPQPTPVKPPKPAPSKPPKPQQARREEQPEPQRSAESKGEKAAPTDQTTRAQGPTGSGGGSARRGPSMVGGLSAYAEDAVDQRPTISRRAMPEYPSGARRRNIQGMVVVRLVVDTSGSPQNCAIHSSSPEGVFDDAALRAAQKNAFPSGKSQRAAGQYARDDPISVHPALKQDITSCFTFFISIARFIVSAVRSGRLRYEQFII